MPLYEYECEKCGVRFEVIQRFSDAPVETCRECGGPVHRLISAPAIQFKGTGWYITDYAKKGSSTVTPSNGSSSSSASKDSSTSASSTPASPSTSSGTSTSKE